MGYLKRGEEDDIKAVFDKYASTVIDGVPYMTDEDFVVKFLQLFPSENFNKNSVKLLCGILDQSKDGLISFEEFARVLDKTDVEQKMSIRFLS